MVGPSQCPLLCIDSSTNKQYKVKDSICQCPICKCTCRAAIKVSTFDFDFVHLLLRFLLTFANAKEGTEQQMALAAAM